MASQRIMRLNGELQRALSDIIYSRYGSLSEVERWLAANDERIQCVVSQAVGGHPRRVDFGKAQQPEPWDYPDGKDVMEFLSSI